MQKISINLQNCYGIRKLNAELDFSKKQSIIIYAANGVMKTSFARTFYQLSIGKFPEDLIYKSRQTICTVQDENGANIRPEEIFVVEPYKNNYRCEKIATLLASQKLRDEYEAIYNDLNKHKDELLKKLKKLSALKIEEIEETLSVDILKSNKEFLPALLSLEPEVKLGEKEQLSKISYKKIFNTQTIDLLSSPEFQAGLAQYMAVYDGLIAKSKYFKKGVFNHNNAEDVAESLDSGGFFKAAHYVYLTDDIGNNEEVKSVEQLSEIIKKEKDIILQDPTLATSFQEIDQKLKRTKGTKDFRAYLEANKGIIPELRDVN